MAPGAYLSLGLCLLGLLASATPEEEGTSPPAPADGAQPTGGEPLAGGAQPALVANGEPEALDAARSARCRRKWVKYLRSCLRFVPISTTAEDAEDECQSYGPDVHLTSIRDAAEATYISNNVIPAGTSEDVWIGLRNTQQTCNFWEWIDGHSLGYVSWGPDQPLKCKTEETYAKLAHSSKFMLWEDRVKDEQSPFLCRHDLE